MQVLLAQAGFEKIKGYFVFDDGSFLSGEGEGAKGLGYARAYEAFSGDLGEVCAVRDYASGNAALYAGLGSRASFDAEAARRAVWKLVEYANRMKLERVALPLLGLAKGMERTVRAVSEAAVLASYRYQEYLSSKKENPFKELVVEVEEAYRGALEEGAVLGLATCEARDLVNEPANVQTPERLAQEASSLGARYGFETTILYEPDVRRLHMEALHAVGRASPNPPVVIVMRYFGDPERPDEITGLIGKGVTYDSGGLNLKSGARFITMKHDMAGGATVIGALCAIARQKLRANVVAVVAACENVIAGNAYKPGDIIGSMAGKTIQVNSTDAEGRLTLVDAIHYAIEEEKASRLVDIATLTGAARRTLGEFGAPVLSNDDGLYRVFEAGAKDAGELVCRIPLVEDAKKRLACDVADYCNTSLAEAGGMVTAALFLREFVQGKPWVHIDAAGPCWLDDEMPYTPKGGSGWGVRALYHMVKKLSR